MSRKSERKKLQRFIDNIFVLTKMLPIKITDSKAREITIKDGDSTIKFFPSKSLKQFIVFRKGEGYCEVTGVKFTKREFERLCIVLDDFVYGNHNMRHNVINSRRAFKGKQNKNKRQ